MPTRLRLSCRALLIIVLARTNLHSAAPQASHQLNPALLVAISLSILKCIFTVVTYREYRDSVGPSAMGEWVRSWLGPL